MDPERWRRVEEMYHLALQIGPGQRKAYLDEACAADQSLRQEVERLLEHVSEAEGFIESPAIEIAAKTLAAEIESTIDSLPGGYILSHYRVLEKIGEGGMGVVYRAKDTMLGRQVAIKILPAAFAEDPGRMARFEREAKLLASLNHSNIASIFGLEEADGKRFIVMELAEGETLAKRISRGPLPVGEALEVCRQVAEGLEAAHEKGIIHRNLKPGNVMVSGEGKVKILDFGLAKALQEVPLASDLANSPTITEAMTRSGVVLGTAAYMSPEQARGKAVDRRADIWAFGCILFECLAGNRAFRGDSVTEVVAKILEAEPDWNQLPADTPNYLRTLLRRCLEKDPRLRLHDIADVRIEIGESAAVAAIPMEAVPAPRRPMLLWLAACVTAAVFAGVFIDRVLTTYFQPAPPAVAGPQQVVRIPLILPRNQVLIRHYQSLAFSPDGTCLVYVANNRLFFRRMDSFESAPISGTEAFIGGPIHPFFSPDGKWIGFCAENRLYTVAIPGGAPRSVCEWTRPPMGASWEPDGSIMFAKGSQGIWEVSSMSGEPMELIPGAADAGAEFHGPQRLASGDWVLFTLRSPQATWDDAQIVAQSLETGERKILISGGADARYLPSGHVVFVRKQNMQAVAIDVERVAILGEPVQIVEGIMQSPINPDAQYCVSGNGALAYRAADSVSGGRRLVWVDRNGQVTEATKDIEPFGFLALSPDGRRAALQIASDRGGDIWIYDLRKQTPPLRLTHAGCNWDPVWTVDGKRVIFSSASVCQTSEDIYWAAANGSTAKPNLVLSRIGRQEPYSFAPDGSLLFVDIPPASVGNIYKMRLDKKSEPAPLLNGEFWEYFPAVSPDGRWIAFTHTRTGQQEVYVASYPDCRNWQRISEDGGQEPRWSHDGRELYYRKRYGRQMMWVAVEDGPDFGFTRPRVLFEGDFWSFGTPSYAVAPDGRFLLIQEQSDAGGISSEIRVVLNWFEELKRLVPTGK